jgi:hypothetical protein
MLTPQELAATRFAMSAPPQPVAVARKLLILMHRLWNTQTPFVPFPETLGNVQRA